MMCMDQWNIVEGHGKMMTKGYEVSEECFLRRRAFVTGRDDERQWQGKGLPYCITINICEEHS